MVQKSSSINIAMKAKKFYCHKCGEKLELAPRTRIIKPDDPDYKKYKSLKHMHTIGKDNIQHTEYDFKCKACNRIISFESQNIIDKIQKKLGNHLLTQSDIDANIDEVKAKIRRNKKIAEVCGHIIFFLLCAYIIYFYFTTGEFHFTIHL